MLYSNLQMLNLKKIILTQMRFKTRAPAMAPKKYFLKIVLLGILIHDFKFKVGSMFLSVLNSLLSENLPGSLTLLFDIFA